MFTLVITACLITITPAKVVKPEDVNCYQLSSVEIYQKQAECEARGAYEETMIHEQRKYFVRYFKHSCEIRL